MKYLQEWLQESVDMAGTDISCSNEFVLYWKRFVDTWASLDPYLWVLVSEMTGV